MGLTKRFHAEWQQFPIVAKAVLLLLPLLPLLCCVSVVFVYRGDGATRLSGQVVGPDDRPIVAAEVRLNEVGHFASTARSATDESGRYSVTLMHAPYLISLTVTITKDGYKTYSKEFRSDERESFSKKVVLEPIPTKE
jgi:hypothetical protein